jgi:hypothetical protein
MNRTTRKLIIPVIMAAIAGASLGMLTDRPIVAQAPNAPASAGTNPSAEDVMRNMDSLIKTSDDSKKPDTQPSATQPAKPPAPAIVNPDAKLIKGISPDAKLQPPKREDQFILNRHGRLVRVDGKSLLVFDADQQTGQEQPMILLPCSKLEYMENISRDRGDRVRFIVSGQILTYRDVNYLLPTIVRETDRRDNLNP